MTESESQDHHDLAARLAESAAARANLETTTTEDREYIKRLEGVIADARTAATEIARTYRVSGDHDTWSPWHEGRSDAANEIGDILARVEMVTDHG